MRAFSIVLVLAMLASVTAQGCASNVRPMPAAADAPTPKKPAAKPPPRAKCAGTPCDNNGHCPQPCACLGRTCVDGNFKSFAKVQDISEPIPEIQLTDDGVIVDGKVKVVKSENDCPLCPICPSPFLKLAAKTGSEYTLSVQISEEAASLIQAQGLGLIVTKGFSGGGDASDNVNWITESNDALYTGTITYTWHFKEKAQLVNSLNVGDILRVQESTTSDIFDAGMSTTFDGVSWSAPMFTETPPEIKVTSEARNLNHVVLYSSYAKQGGEVAWSPYFATPNPIGTGAYLAGHPLVKLGFKLSADVSNGKFAGSVVAGLEKFDYGSDMDLQVCIYNPESTRLAFIKGKCPS